MITEFATVPLGELFQFRGRRFRKVALSLAQDEERVGCVFQANTEVLAEVEGRASQSTQRLQWREPPCLLKRESTDAKEASGLVRPSLG